MTKSSVPGHMPEDLSVQLCKDLMATIEGFCNESALPRTEIIGALEGVKFSLLRSWFRDQEQEQEE